MCRNTAEDEKHRRYVSAASDGTLLANTRGRFWFVDLPAGEFRASEICRVSATVNQAIKKAAALNASEVATLSIRKARYRQ